MPRAAFIFMAVIAAYDAAMAIVNFALWDSPRMGAIWAGIALGTIALTIRMRIRDRPPPPAAPRQPRFPQSAARGATNVVIGIDFVPAADEPQREASPLQRSSQLLLSFLTPEQRAEWTNPSKRSFIVKAKDSKLYRLVDRMNGNVIDQRGQAWCALAMTEDKNAFLPLYDSLLAIKLLLETAPEEYFAIAMKYGGPGEEVGPR